jgi:phytoene dehydrogenase-like protein
VRYDTLIIGAGFSGLAAGIRLAHFEKRVCVLERHTTIGGLNSFYRLRGRNYDVGLHAVTNYAPPGTRTGPLSKLLRQLRLRWDDFSLAPQAGSRISFPQVSLRFDNDLETLIEQVRGAFPADVDGLRRLSRFVSDCEPGTVFDRSALARPFLRDYLRDLALADMLLCPIMFYGSPTAGDIELTQFVILFRSIFLEGLARPRAGVRQLLRQLVRRYRELGGELRLRAGVASIVVDQGRARGVLLDDGSEIEADSVLSSAGLVETLALCGEQNLPGGAPPGGLAGEISFFETIATLDRPPAELGLNETAVFYCNTPTFSYGPPATRCDLNAGIVCSPDNFAYKEPLAESSVRVTTLANCQSWMNLPEDAYQEQKLAWRDRVVDSALPHVPDFRPAVVDTDTFTPRTIRHYTGHVNGAVYGARSKHWDGLTPIENLYLCGTDQGYLGIVGSMLSGITMANRHVLQA